MKDAFATKDLCIAAFAALEEHFGRKPLRPLVSLPDVAAPLFVTFRTANGALRGCIGNFAPEPLAAQVARYALNAALHDGRFTPLRDSELPGLRCTVSTLHSFENIKRWDDWTVGVHGVRIRGSHRGRSFSSTFLPGVATQQGWDHAQTMAQLFRKAGVAGATRPEEVDQLAVERYRHTEASLTYEEFRDVAGDDLPPRAAGSPSTCAAS